MHVYLQLCCGGGATENETAGIIIRRSMITARDGRGNNSSAEVGATCDI